MPESARDRSWLDRRNLRPSGPGQERYALQEELFLQAMARVRADHPGVEVGAGLKGVQLLDWSDSTLHIEVSHEFARKLFERSVRQPLETALRDAVGAAVCVRVHVARQPTAAAEKHARRSRRAGSDLNAFILDDGNRMAHRLLMHYRNGSPLFDPLVLHGPARCGKTHLLRGFLAFYRSQAAPGAAIYLTASMFSRAYRATQYRRRLDRFRDEMDEPRLLLIDDLHDLATMPGTQREIVRLLDRRQARGHRTVVAGREPPGPDSALDDALRSRLSGGVVVPVKAVEPGSVVRHLKSRLAKRGVRVDASVLERAVSLAEGHPVAAETLVLDAVIESRQTRRPLTSDIMTARAAEDPPGGGARPGAFLAEATDPGSTSRGVEDPDRMDRATTWIAGHFGVSPAELKSARKVRRALVPRRVLALLLRQGLGLTSARIGRYLGGRSISTVTVLLRQGKALVAEDDDLRNMVEHWIQELAPHARHRQDG